MLSIPGLDFFVPAIWKETPPHARPYRRSSPSALSAVASHRGGGSDAVEDQELLRLGSDRPCNGTGHHRERRAQGLGLHRELARRRQHRRRRCRDRRADRRQREPAPRCDQGALHQPKGSRKFVVTVTEQGNPAQTVSTPSRVTALRVDVKPSRARPRSRITFRGTGFTGKQRTIWAHYVRGNSRKAKKTVRLGARQGRLRELQGQAPPVPLHPAHRHVDRADRSAEALLEAPELGVRAAADRRAAHPAPLTGAVSGARTPAYAG